MTHAVTEFVRALEAAQILAGSGRGAAALDDALARAEQWLQVVDEECAAREARVGPEAAGAALALRARLDRLRWALQRAAAR